MKGGNGKKMWIECGKGSAEGMVRTGRGRWGGRERRKGGGDGEGGREVGESAYQCRPMR